MGKCFLCRRLGDKGEMEPDMKFCHHKCAATAYRRPEPGAEIYENVKTLQRFIAHFCPDITRRKGVHLCQSVKFAGLFNIAQPF